MTEMRSICSPVLCYQYADVTVVDLTKRLDRRWSENEPRVVWLQDVYLFSLHPPHADCLTTTGHCTDE